jgi:hypothetical protein
MLGSVSITTSSGTVTVPVTLNPAL